MLRIFKNKKKTSSSKRGIDYYNRENQIQTIGELSTVLSKLNSQFQSNTETKLVFHNKELSSITKSKLQDDFGKHSCVLNPESGINGHEIYFYRIVSGDFRFLQQLHFIDNDFFFAATKISTEAAMTEKEKKIIVDSIKKKYFPNEDCKNENYEIKDPLGNILLTYDNIFYYLKYVVNNDISKKLLAQYGNGNKYKLGEDIDSAIDNMI